MPGSWVGCSQADYTLDSHYVEAGEYLAGEGQRIGVAFVLA